VIELGLALFTSFCVAALLVVSRLEKRALEWIFKPLAALGFIAMGLASGALSSAWGTVLFAGLIFAAAGDVLLIPKSKKFFLAGLVSFLVGHVAYAVAFAMRGISFSVTEGATLVMLVVAVPVLFWLWPHVEQKMRSPVLAYVTVITGMVALSLGTFAEHGDWRIPAGAFAFYLSDLSVARERFVGRSFTNRLWGLPLYFGAQLILAWSAGS
jgi:uncharacterized membrane protein YhhN